MAVKRCRETPGIFFDSEIVMNKPRTGITFKIIAGAVAIVMDGLIWFIEIIKKIRRGY
jgi:hypothetical protein